MNSPLSGEHEISQHGNCSTARLRPRPDGRKVSDWSSRERHWGRYCSFLAFAHFPSISLCPFAPPELPGFIATMDTLTPGGRVISGVCDGGLWFSLRTPTDPSRVCQPGCLDLAGALLPIHSQSVASCFPLRSPCLTCGTFRSFRLQPPCCCPRSLVWFSLRGLPRGTVFQPSTSRKGFVASWASRVPSRLATATGRIEFVSYGLTVHLPLLSTPPHDGCSYGRLQCSNPTLTGTCTPPIPHARKRTRHHRSA